MYTLSRACWIVRKVDSSAGRLAVFDDVIRKSVKIRFFYKIYEKSPIYIKLYLLLIYGLKCYLSLSWHAPKNLDILLFASYPNEHIAIDQVQRNIHGLKIGHLTISKYNCFRLGSLKDLPAFLISLVRLQRVAKKLVRRFQFMPACRIFSTMTYYARCRRLLMRFNTKAVFIANHYSPECLALAAAAHRSNIKVLFTNHANATHDTGYLPPLHCDLAAVTSRAVLDVYQRHSRRQINATFIPIASPQRPMQCQIDVRHPLTVGIFLTALTNLERLSELVGQLNLLSKVARILIRLHPVRIVNDDLEQFCADGGRIHVTRGMPLFKNITECDIAICGNSTVTVEILRGGVPVFYDSELDRIVRDYNGYLKHQLVLPIPSKLDELTFKCVSRFFCNSSWESTMRYFDAAYLEDEDQMLRQLNKAVRDAIL